VFKRQKECIVIDRFFKTGRRNGFISSYLTRDSAEIQPSITMESREKNEHNVILARPRSVGALFDHARL